MYGGSLYDLAAEEGLEARILGELDEAVALFKANPDYLHLLSTPSIPKRERCGLLDEALRDQVHLYVLNFLKILCEKGTLRELSGCARAYRVRYNQAHGILEATATTEIYTLSLHDALPILIVAHPVGPGAAGQLPQGALLAQDLQKVQHIEVDRKSTRLNSSH